MSKSDQNQPILIDQVNGVILNLKNSSWVPTESDALEVEKETWKHLEKGFKPNLPISFEKESFNSFQDFEKKYKNGSNKKAYYLILSIRRTQRKYKEIISKKNKYGRQYFGTYKNNEKILEVNYFPLSSKDWKTKRVFVLDGGSDYFTVYFNVNKKEIISVKINGEA